MPKILILPKEILAEIRAIAFETDLETGVRLVGTSDRGTYVVRHVIGPGHGAIRERRSYEPDNDYAEEVYNRLLEDDPGLRWLGELHVHPSGFPDLSPTDHATIREVLLGDDDAFHPDEFIAGVLQRVDGTIRVRPLLFTRTDLKGEPLDVRTEPQGTRGTRRKACGRHRLRQRRIGRGRDFGAGRHRHARSR